MASTVNDWSVQNRAGVAMVMISGFLTLWRTQDFVLRGPENRGAVGAEFETPKVSSREGNREPWRGYPPLQPTRGYSLGLFS